MGSDCISSWLLLIFLLYELVEKYDLPPPSEITHLSKEQWKILVKKTIRCYWTEQLQREAGEKSKLERCHLDILHLGITHRVWDSVKPNRMDVMRDSSRLVQMIVDCQKLVLVTIPDNKELLRSIEVNSRILCYKLHLKRLYLDRVKRIWYLSPMRAAKVQASLRIPGPSEWLGMRS